MGTTFSHFGKSHYFFVPLYCQIKKGATTMVNIGQVIAVDLLRDGNEEFYWRTRESKKIVYGLTAYLFCRVKPTSEITPEDIWGVTENYFDHLVNNGQLRVTDKIYNI